jgi:carboxymethylenebutenolidase
VSLALTLAFFHSILNTSTNITRVTGPVARFARQIASQGYIVAAPSSYHEFTGPEALAYDGPGTDAGNEWKITKKVEAYDEDAKLSVDLLMGLETCNGRVGATGEFYSIRPNET